MIAKKEEELELFFEKDIIEFLDQKNTKGAKDITKELEDAIISKNFEDASKLIEYAIEKFNKTDTKDVYREINFNKVRELIAKAQELTKNIKHKNRLTENINLLKNSSQLTQDPSKNITALEERDRKEEQILEELEQEDVQKAKDIENKLANLNKQLFVSIRKKDLKKAITQYRDIKTLFEEYPSKFQNEKTELYNDIIAFFMRIKKLKDEIKQTSDTKLKDLTKPQLSEKYIKIEEIKEIVTEIKQDIKQQNFKDAKTKILNFKHKISLIPQSYSNVKIRLENIASSLMQKLEFYKKTNN